MNVYRPLALCVLILMSLSACDQGPQQANNSISPDIEAPSAIVPAHQAAPELVPLSAVDLKASRRMTVDQLRRSVPLLFGGERWTARFQQRNVDLFEGLARTLGEADFLEVTTPNLEPGPLFQKFMDDMSANLCTKAVSADMSTDDESLRNVVRYRNDTDANLRFLRLKFHAVFIPEDTSPEEDGLDELRSLYTDLESEHDAQTAWIGVCMAIVTAPEFLAY